MQCNAMVSDIILTCVCCTHFVRKLTIYLHGEVRVGSCSQRINHNIIINQVFIHSRVVLCRIVLLLRD